MANLSAYNRTSEETQRGLPLVPECFLRLVKRGEHFAANSLTIVPQNIILLRVYFSSRMCRRIANACTSWLPRALKGYSTRVICPDAVEIIGLFALTSERPSPDGIIPVLPSGAKRR